MFSRKETTKLRQQFWMAFGQYMAPILSEEGEKINWINYKTGIKGLQFKMEAVGERTFISIEINHPDLVRQQIIFEKFEGLKKILTDNLNEDWLWQLHAATDEGKTISKIYIERRGLSLMRKDDWPALISFFKPRILALDKFWSETKYALEALQ